MTDAERAEKLIAIVRDLDLGSADGRAGVKAILREIEQRAPGTVEQMAARPGLGWLKFSSGPMP